MSFSDPYQAYAEGSVTSGGPLHLVLALYEGAINAIREAKACVDVRDIPGRTKAVNKAMELVTELLSSLDHSKGGEISANLQRLYSYVQCRVLFAHYQQSSQPLIEAETLLQTMLEGWQGAARKMAEASAVESAVTISGVEARGLIETGSAYSPFLDETSDWASGAGVSAVF